MAILVRELRLSLIWNKVFFKDTYLTHLADPGQYAVEFEKAREQAGAWLLPWIPGDKQHFWQYYLLPVAPGSFEAVTAQDARACFVPLRLPACAQAIARDGTVATLEGFCFPHSVGVVATIHVRPENPLSLLQMVEAAVSARNADFQLVWKDKVPATHGNLQSLADKVVGRLHTLALGDGNAIGKPLPYPITIATVIDATFGESPAETTPNTAPPIASGEIPAAPTPAANSVSGQAGPAGSSDPVNPDDQLLGRAMNALCRLQSGWRTKKFEGGCDDYADPMGNQLVAIDRGRAIWLPQRFSEIEIKGRKTALGCYHRNLTLAALQTAALTALVGRADEVLADPKGKLLLLQPKDVAVAIGLLRKLKDGDYTSYRTWSLKHQISFNDDRMQRVAAKLGA